MTRIMCNAAARALALIAAAGFPLCAAAFDPTPRTSRIEVLPLRTETVTTTQFLNGEHGRETIARERPVDSAGEQRKARARARVGERNRLSIFVDDAQVAPQMDCDPRWKSHVHRAATIPLGARFVRADRVARMQLPRYHRAQPSFADVDCPSGNTVRHPGTQYGDVYGNSEAVTVSTSGYATRNCS